MVKYFEIAGEMLPKFTSTLNEIGWLYTKDDKQINKWSRYYTRRIVYDAGSDNSLLVPEIYVDIRA